MRRRTALLGLFAILLQAVLFGWHHHAERFAAAASWPALSASQSGEPLSPAVLDDDCELCAALHHLTGAPGAFAAALLPGASALPLPSLSLLHLVGGLALSFNARAPPLV